MSIFLCGGKNNQIGKIQDTEEKTTRKSSVKGYEMGSGSREELYIDNGMKIKTSRMLKDTNDLSRIIF